MTGRILVLGAAGRLGRAAAQAFRDAGWNVASLTRARSIHNIVPGTEPVELDANDAPSVVEAAAGADLILHALNPPFTEWRRLVPHFATAATVAARRSGAPLMFPGNIYNYGSPLPALIDETTPMRPTSRKGKMRVEIEAYMRAAADDGVRTIVLRTGDFYGGTGLGSWFDRIIVKDIVNGNATYPGPTGLTHAWAYLPDVADTMVRLAQVRAGLPAFASFGFAGHAVTGNDLVAALAHAIGRYVAVNKMPWTMLRLLGPFVPIFRELAETAYLWREPHRIDEGRLRAAIGAVPHTPFNLAVATALDELHPPTPAPRQS